MEDPYLALNMDHQNEDNPQKENNNQQPERPNNFMSLVHHKWRKIFRRDSADITPSDPSYKTVYLGNVVTTWAKGEGCLERPASALWKNHCQGRGSIKMLISVAPSGLKAQTREHGLTEYWANRLTWCGVPPDYPKLFCWIYRHEGRKLKQELRCHAVLCTKEVQAQRLASCLKNRLTEALFDFKKEKILRQNARLSLVHNLYNTSATKRKLVLLNSNSQNYKPPLERSKSAPKLSCIEEFEEEENEENLSPAAYRHACNGAPMAMTIPEEEFDIVQVSEVQRGDEVSKSISPIKSSERVESREEEEEEEEEQSHSMVPHRKSVVPSSEVTSERMHLPQRPYTVPMDALRLNLPSMTGYDKVMHLLDLSSSHEGRHPDGDEDEEEEDDFLYGTNSNSDPVTSDQDNDSVVSELDEVAAGRRRGSSRRRRRRSCERSNSNGLSHPSAATEDNFEEINDNVSDESGYSEETTSTNNRLISEENNKRASDKQQQQQCTKIILKSSDHHSAPATLVVYDNLCFEI